MNFIVELSQNNAESPNKPLPKQQIVNFIFGLFDDLKKSPKKRDLVAFHTKNKYLLMAHNQKQKAILGNLVANRDKKPLEEIIIKYEDQLRIALSSEPTIKTNCNALMHMMGFFKKNLSPTEKDFFWHLIAEYQNEKITLGDALAQIEPLIHRFNRTYLANQTYFLLYTNKRPGNLIGLMSK